MGLVFATAPLSAFAFAGSGSFRCTERLSLWIVPAMYVGLALLVDGAVRLGRDAYHRRQWTQLTLAALLARRRGPVVRRHHRGAARKT